MHSQCVWLANRIVNFFSFFLTVSCSWIAKSTNSSLFSVEEHSSPNFWQHPVHTPHRWSTTAWGWYSLFGAAYSFKWPVYKWSIEIKELKIIYIFSCIPMWIKRGWGFLHFHSAAILIFFLYPTFFNPVVNAIKLAMTKNKRRVIQVVRVNIVATRKKRKRHLIVTPKRRRQSDNQVLLSDQFYVTNCVWCILTIAREEAWLSTATNALKRNPVKIIPYRLLCYSLTQTISSGLFPDTRSMSPCVGVL